MTEKLAQVVARVYVYEPVKKEMHGGQESIETEQLIRNKGIVWSPNELVRICKQNGNKQNTQKGIRWHDTCIQKRKAARWLHITQGEFTKMEIRNSKRYHGKDGC